MGSRIVIAGAGGFGREVHAWLDSSPRFREENAVDEIVFINDGDPEVPVPARVVSRIDEFVPQPNDLVLCAIGVPASRRAVVQKLSDKGAAFATFVHDRAILGANVTIGEGSVVCPGVIITTDIRIGEQVHVNINSSIGHDVTIGDYVTLSPACNLMGGVNVAGDVFFGTAVTVIPGRTIGARSVVGAGSVVVKNVPADVTSFGNPSTTFTKPTTD